MDALIMGHLKSSEIMMFVCNQVAKSHDILMFVCNQVAKSGEILRFVSLQKDAKQIWNNVVTPQS